MYSIIICEWLEGHTFKKKRTLHKNSLYQLKTHIRQIWGCWFQIWSSSFRILAQKYPNKAFLLPDLGVLGFFLQNFVIRQIKGCWFQIWQYHFQLPALKYPNQVFWVPKLRAFIFCTELYNTTNSGVLISNMTMISQNCCPKHPNKTFLVPNLRILIFARNFAIRQI